MLNNINLVKRIKQASPFAQTSCLEGFHSVLNHFAPKMIAFSYVGMYCRYNHAFFSKSIIDFTVDLDIVEIIISLIIHQLKVNCNNAMSSPAGILLLLCIPLDTTLDS